MSASIAASVAQQQSTGADVVKVFEGLLEGAVEAEGLENIQTCIQDLETGYHDAEQTYGDCTTKSPTARIKCISDIKTLLTDVQAIESDCSAVKADWEKIRAMEAIFANPASFEFHVAKDVILNHAEIGKNIVAAEEAYKNKEWREFGLHLGKAAAKTLLGSTKEELEFAGVQMPQEAPVEENTMTKEQFAQMIAGILESYGVKIDVLALLICIQEEDKALMAATAGVQTIE